MPQYRRRRYFRSPLVPFINMYIRPFAIVTMGYPAETPKQPEGRYKPEKIHWGCWENTDAPVETAAE